MDGDDGGIMGGIDLIDMIEGIDVIGYLFRLFYGAGRGIEN